MTVPGEASATEYPAVASMPVASSNNEYSEHQATMMYAEGQSALYPSAKAEPDLGTGASSGVVATVEMTPIHEIKTEPTMAIVPAPQQPQPQDTVVIPESITSQEKLGAKYLQIHWTRLLPAHLLCRI